eukprot:s1299_g13.t1
MGGDKVFEDKVLASLRKDFEVGSEDKNDVMFVGPRIKWKTHDKYGPYISVDQKLAVDAVEEVKIDKTLKDNIQCNPQLHTAYRSVRGQLNWLQSRTQVHLCYKFSRCASAASSPPIGDVREINKVVRTLKSQYVDGRVWPLKGPQRILGMPDASYRNNSDKSSQRAHVIFLAEDRKIPSKASYRSSGYDKKPDASTRGSIIDYESGSRRPDYSGRRREPEQRSDSMNDAFNSGALYQQTNAKSFQEALLIILKGGSASVDYDGINKL